MKAGPGDKHAFLIGGTHSGCGKTTITLGLLAALKGRGFRVQPFKVGPDFIDPGLHTQVAGVQSRNLDGWMLGRGWNAELFRRLLDVSDVGLIEGVMGIFDGYGGDTESGSSAEMAKWLDVPAVLVVNARSMARSAAALIYGFLRFDPALKYAGVIFNQIGGEGHLEYLKEALDSACPEIAVLGGIPREDLVRMPERHLGLVTADEMELDADWQKRLVDLLEKRLDIGLLLERTRYLNSAPFPGGETQGERKDGDGESAAHGSSISLLNTMSQIKPTIAVARDAAFCFYYPDNLELLEKAGAQLHYFSPLDGEALPAQCSGAYLGGGYPELFAEAISGNAGFIRSIRERAAQGMPIYAECGGLMTLGRFIETIEGQRFEMAGIMPFGTRMLPARKALGYTEVVLRRDCLLGGPGSVMRGHEFHYSEIIEFGEKGSKPQEAGGAQTEDGTSIEFVYELRRRKGEKFSDRPEGYLAGSVLASYIHLHWGSAPEAADRFVRRCADWAQRRS
jgi:cobyrinic acid a,c-diamide synthase